ncbi:hypothetical protein BDQ17DRAFT_1320851 [Cyathus striatus]|nr:hypothetical protein BDQ17DRAFT_1320851 [Cyathus striatus]
MALEIAREAGHTIIADYIAMARKRRRLLLFKTVVVAGYAMIGLKNKKWRVRAAISPAVYTEYIAQWGRVTLAKHAKCFRYKKIVFGSIFAAFTDTTFAGVFASPIQVETQSGTRLTQAQAETRLKPHTSRNLRTVGMDIPSRKLLVEMSIAMREATGTS